jgi:hypothetical protein
MANQEELEKGLKQADRLCDKFIELCAPERLYERVKERLIAFVDTDTEDNDD